MKTKLQKTDFNIEPKLCLHSGKKITLFWEKNRQKLKKIAQK
jgi:hypothetical protein